MVAAKRVLRYLRGTPDLPTVYRRGPLELFGFTDSDLKAAMEKELQSLKEHEVADIVTTDTLPTGASSISSRGNTDVVLSIYVDDVLLLGVDPSIVNNIREQLMNNFSMINLGSASLVLGMEIEEEGGYIKVSQGNYVNSISSKFDFHESNPAPTPGTGKPLARNPDGAVYLDKRHQELVGTLMYMVKTTRWDIAHAVLDLTRGMAAPTEEHLVADKRVLRYLRGTPDLPTVYQKGPLELVGFTDSDFAGELESRRSSTGFLFMLGGGVISSASVLQKTIAQSTTEAELIGLHGTSQEGIYLLNLLRELGVDIDKFKLFTDAMRRAFHNVFLSSDLGGKVYHSAMRFPSNSMRYPVDPGDPASHAAIWRQTDAIAPLVSRSLWYAIGRGTPNVRLMDLGNLQLPSEALPEYQRPLLCTVSEVRAPLSRSEALKLFPIGYRLSKEFEGGLKMHGVVFDYFDSYWKVRYSDHDWEDLTRWRPPSRVAAAATALQAAAAITAANQGKQMAQDRVFMGNAGAASANGEEYPDMSVFIADSASTINATGNGRHVYNRRSPTALEATLIVGDGRKMSVSCYGDLDVLFYSERSPATHVTIRNLAVMEGRHFDLFSLKKAQEHRDVFMNSTGTYTLHDKRSIDVNDLHAALGHAHDANVAEAARQRKIKITGYRKYCGRCGGGKAIGGAAGRPAPLVGAGASPSTPVSTVPGGSASRDVSVGGAAGLPAPLVGAGGSSYTPVGAAPGQPTGGVHELAREAHFSEENLRTYAEDGTIPSAILDALVPVTDKNNTVANTRATHAHGNREPELSANNSAEDEEGDSDARDKQGSGAEDGDSDARVPPPFLVETSAVMQTGEHLAKSADFKPLRLRTLEATTKETGGDMTSQASLGHQANAEAAAAAGRAPPVLPENALVVTYTGNMVSDFYDRRLFAAAYPNLFPHAVGGHMDVRSKHFRTASVTGWYKKAEATWLSATSWRRLA
eukprot:g20789.t1